MELTQEKLNAIPLLQQFQAAVPTREWITSQEEYISKLPYEAQQSLLTQVTKSYFTYRDNIYLIWKTTNDYLRSMLPSSEITPELQQFLNVHINNLQKLILEAPRLDKDLYVYRGLDVGESWNQDNIITFDGFTSTSLSLQYTVQEYIPKGHECCLMKILLPKGTPCIWDLHELQILLPANSRFEIRNVEYNPIQVSRDQVKNFRIIRAEYIDTLLEIPPEQLKYLKDIGYRNLQINRYPIYDIFTTRGNIPEFLTLYNIIEDNPVHNQDLEEIKLNLPRVEEITLRQWNLLTQVTTGSEVKQLEILIKFYNSNPDGLQRFDNIIQVYFSDSNDSLINLKKYIPEGKNLIIIVSEKYSSLLPLGGHWKNHYDYIHDKNLYRVFSTSAPSPGTYFYNIFTNSLINFSLYLNRINKNYFFLLFGDVNISILRQNSVLGLPYAEVSIF